jgi:hypothetical protein
MLKRLICPNCDHRGVGTTIPCLKCRVTFGVTSATRSNASMGLAVAALSDVAEPGSFPVSGYAIIAPAGKCPVAYQGDLESWVGHLQSHAGANRYAACALRYWLRGLVSQDEFTALAPRLPALCGEGETCS